jgi:hypothetical protein
MRIWWSSTSITLMSYCKWALRTGIDQLLKFSRLAWPKRSINAGSIWIGAPACSLARSSAGAAAAISRYQLT